MTGKTIKKSNNNIINIALAAVVALLLQPFSSWAQTTATHAATAQDPDLTYVPRLQRLAERLLENRQGSIVAIRPTTGEILCMASNTLKGDPINRAVQATYPPGSTIKAAQLLTLYSEGIVTRDTKVACHRGFMMGGTHVGCHYHASPLSTVQALAQSCNSWFITNFIRMIGDTTRYGSRSHAVDVWHDYMTSYGFGTKTGVDYGGEARGIIPDSAYVNRKYPKFWNARTIGYIGMGQGLITVTPLQLCNLAATIANRGWWMTPYHRYSTAGADPEAYINPHRTKASPAAYNIVIEGMRACVKNGTAKAIDDPRITICGKTGTAQNGGIDHSAFIAFAPMDNPQIAVCAYIEHGGDGNKTAAPIAAQIIKSYLLPTNAKAVPGHRKNAASAGLQKKSGSARGTQKKAPANSGAKKTPSPRRK